jgi:hypothetical protein
VLNVGDEIFAGDFKGRILSNTGDGSMTGKAAIKIPYLADAEIEATFTNVAFNECYELQAGAENKLVSVFDTTGSGIINVDDVIDGFKSLITDFADLLKTYRGTPEEKAKIDYYITKMKERANEPNLIPEVKIELETKLNLISTTWNEVKTCPLSGNNLRTSAENALQTDCKLKELQDQADDLTKVSLKPTNRAFPELNIPFRCNTNIPIYWQNVLGLKTTAPQQYPDATGFNWNITQYTLYDPNWKTNNKWWWIKEVCTPDNCENTQMYVYSPKHDDYILMYDKNADCEQNMQAMIELADDIGNTYAFILGIMLGGPEDLIFEYGGVAIRYVGAGLNAARKSTKAKNFAKAVTLYIKESKLAKAAGQKVDDIKTWWKKLKQGNNAGDDLLGFVNKSLSQKLDDIAGIWNKKYPVQEMLEGRSFFEDIMGHYRYAKGSGWSHTGDISEFFKGVDFYDTRNKHIC